MPRSLPCRPRKILPPPTTTTTWTPSSRTSRICCAISCTASGRIPIPPSPPSASPLSLSSTRLYLGRLDSFFMAATVEMRRRVVTASRQDVNQHGKDRDCFEDKPQSGQPACSGNAGGRGLIRSRGRALADLEADKAADGDLVTQLLGDRANVL